MPGGIRTPNLLIRSQKLYPVELQALLRTSILYFTPVPALVKNSTTDRRNRIGAAPAQFRWQIRDHNISRRSDWRCHQSNVHTGAVIRKRPSKLCRINKRRTSVTTATRQQWLRSEYECAEVRPANFGFVNTSPERLHICNLSRQERIYSFARIQKSVFTNP